MNYELCIEFATDPVLDCMLDCVCLALACLQLGWRGLVGQLGVVESILTEFGFHAVPSELVAAMVNGALSHPSVKVVQLTLCPVVMVLR